MRSPAAERAISDAYRVESALLKTISPNDVGLTGSHQAGYYLPKKAWFLFTPFEPTDGENFDHPITAVWPDGVETSSTVKWYGRGTRSEYRLTGFNRIRHFPYLTEDCVGSLLVIVPELPDKFLMHVLDLEEDIEEVLAALGADIAQGWAIFDSTRLPPLESEDECLDRRFREYVLDSADFPPTQELSEFAHLTLVECVREFQLRSVDERLVEEIEEEYRLFKMLERKICEPDIVRVFKSIEDFLDTAQTIVQRRRARAGRSFEHHVRRNLIKSQIPFEVNQKVDDTEPDILIPGKSAYDDPNFPLDKLFMVGLKTTCKDRWRQVLNEAPRVQHRHILTLQQGISVRQLQEMQTSGVRLVVPAPLHKWYPPERRDDLLSVEQFVGRVRDQLAIS